MSLVQNFVNSFFIRFENLKKWRQFYFGKNRISTTDLNNNINTYLLYQNLQTKLLKIVTNNVDVGNLFVTSIDKNNYQTMI